MIRHLLKTLEKRYLSNPKFVFFLRKFISALQREQTNKRTNRRTDLHQKSRVLRLAHMCTTYQISIIYIQPFLRYQDHRKLVKKKSDSFDLKKLPLKDMYQSKTHAI